MNKLENYVGRMVKTTIAMKEFTVQVVGYNASDGGWLILNTTPHAFGWGKGQESEGDVFSILAVRHWYARPHQCTFINNEILKDKDVPTPSVPAIEVKPIGGLPV